MPFLQNLILQLGIVELFNFKKLFSSGKLCALHHIGGSKTNHTIPFSALHHNSLRRLSHGQRNVLFIKSMSS